MTTPPTSLYLLSRLSNMSNSTDNSETLNYNEEAKLLLEVIQVTPV